MIARILQIIVASAVTLVMIGFTLGAWMMASAQRDDQGRAAPQDVDGWRARLRERRERRAAIDELVGSATVEEQP